MSDEVDISAGAVERAARGLEDSFNGLVIGSNYRHEAKLLRALQARVAELEDALKDADEGCHYMHLYEKEGRG